MTIVSDYLDYAELSQAAYGDFNQPGISYNDILTDKKYNVGFTESQAKDFADKYQVVATSSQYGIGALSGFSATLFSYKENGVKKYVFAIRGTDQISLGSPQDLGDDLWNGLMFGKVPEQFEDMVDFYTALKSSGALPAGTSISVTGHSLGGPLAQMFTAAFKDEVSHTYTYNAPGAKDLALPTLHETLDGNYLRLDDLLYVPVSAEAGDAYYAFDANRNQVDGKVVNIQAVDGPSVISDLGTDIGSTRVPVFINADTDYFSYNHSIKTLTDVLSFHAALSTIDGSLTTAAINSICQGMKEIYGSAFPKESLFLEVDKRIGEILDIQFTGTSANLVDFSEEMIKSKKSGTIQSLADVPASALEFMARGETASLYALTKLNPFVIRGQDIASYAALAPGDYSDNWYSDRSEFLTRIIHPVSSLTRYRDLDLGLDTHDPNDPDTVADRENRERVKAAFDFYQAAA